MSSDQATPVSRPWRRFLRFSVRGMIVIVLLVGGWLGWIVRSARIQRDAVAAITNVGGKVGYDWEYRDDGTKISGGSLQAPAWVVDLIGADHFGHVVGARVLASDATLARVGHLTELRRLNLVKSSFGDAGLGQLEGLAKLRRLDICFTSVTDAELVHLIRLTKLSELDLTSTAITNNGLVHLHGLKKLSTLKLYRTRVTDAGVKELQQALPSLTILR